MNAAKRSELRDRIMRRDYPGGTPRLELIRMLNKTPGAVLTYGDLSTYAQELRLRRPEWYLKSLGRESSSLQTKCTAPVATPPPRDAVEIAIAYAVDWAKRNGLKSEDLQEINQLRAKWHLPPFTLEHPSTGAHMTIWPPPVLMSQQDRIDSYVQVTGFPRSLFVAEDGRIVGTWIMGNDYRVKSHFYGGYPSGYLRRIKTLFPEKIKILHLFSGKVDTAVMPGDTVDINPALTPTFLDDAQTLEKVPLSDYDLILADPPYSEDDAEHYGTTMVKRNTVLKALQRCRSGTHIV